MIEGMKCNSQLLSGLHYLAIDQNKFLSTPSACFVHSFPPVSILLALSNISHFSHSIALFPSSDTSWVANRFVQHDIMPPPPRNHTAYTIFAPFPSLLCQGRHKRWPRLPCHTIPFLPPGPGIETQPNLRLFQQAFIGKQRIQRT